MRRIAVSLLVLVAIGWGGAFRCAAAIRPYEKLSVAEQVALQESERRVCIYDRELQTLDHQRARRKISAGDYEWSTSQLTFCLQQETLFQNAILVRRSDLPQRAKDVLETMEHGVLAVPVGIGCVVAACPQVLEFLACIH